MGVTNVETDQLEEARKWVLTFIDDWRDEEFKEAVDALIAAVRDEQAELLGRTYDAGLKVGEHIWRDQPESDAEVLRAALQAIVDYERPFHSPTDEERAESQACEECERARQREWPPSRVCDKHYRILISKYQRANEIEVDSTGWKMKDIARAALAAAREARNA